MITSTVIDRAARGWPSGPWDGEPDLATWIDELTGLACRAVRSNAYGAWCGYVRLPHGHQLHAVEHESDDMPNFAVHGGVTYAGYRGDGSWWIGFDCMHYGDSTPMGAKLKRDQGGVFTPEDGAQYRTLDYVRQQCTLLALQIAKFGNDETVK